MRKDRRKARFFKGQAPFEVKRQSLAGQAALEYILLFIAVTLGLVIGTRRALPFLSFDGKGTGQAKNIAQNIFNDKAQEILGRRL